LLRLPVWVRGLPYPTGRSRVPRLPPAARDRIAVINAPRAGSPVTWVTGEEKFSLPVSAFPNTLMVTAERAASASKARREATRSALSCGHRARSGSRSGTRRAGGDANQWCRSLQNRMDAISAQHGARTCPRFGWAIRNVVTRQLGTDAPRRCCHLQSGRGRHCPQRIRAAMSKPQSHLGIFRPAGTKLGACYTNAGKLTEETRAARHCCARPVSAGPNRHRTQFP